MSRSWKTMRSQRESPEFERDRRNGSRGNPYSSWRRPDVDMDDILLSKDRFRERMDRSRLRLAASNR